MLACYVLIVQQPVVNSFGFADLAVAHIIDLRHRAMTRRLTRRTMTDYVIERSCQMTPLSVNAAIGLALKSKLKCRNDHFHALQNKICYEKPRLRESIAVRIQ